MRKHAQKKKKGFTLIELIIVLAILAIIAAIAIPNFASVRKNAANKTDVQSANVIKRTLTMYIADGTIPIPTTAITNATITVSGSTISLANFPTGTQDTVVKDGLKDVKSPQGYPFTYTSGEPTFDESGTKATHYVVGITDKGDVSVLTDN